MPRGRFVLEWIRADARLHRGRLPGASASTEHFVAMTEELFLFRESSLVSIYFAILIYLLKPSEIVL